MQDIIIEKPYEFVPPHRGKFWSAWIQYFNLHGWYLKKYEGVDSYQCRHVERLQASLAAGHGILLTPNHCRTADPVVLGWLAREAKSHFYAMASWHLFHQGRLRSWAIQRIGAFSVYREGIDRQAISTAIEILETAERPLVIFPEGTTTRTNDRLQSLLDGVAFIARSAAKKRARAEQPGKVVVHPIGIKYLFQGDLRKAIEPVLTEIEHRLTWPTHRGTILDRIGRIGLGLLSLKELECLGRTQTGTLAERLHKLIEEILGPLEQEWFGKGQSGAIVPRVKGVRMKILPEMMAGQVPAEERKRRWKQLADLYLAQQLACYPPDYLAQPTTVTRILETVERFEEDLTDHARIHGHLQAVIEVDAALEVSPDRDRKAEVDPLMTAIESRLQGMLNRLSGESPLWKE